jgi:ubiquitin carboxyl-terminal hydrolase 4/11/15
MDPQSVAFVPHTDSWRPFNDLLRLQQVQAEHADRLVRLERRQDDDARMKSLWGATSPFPSVLTPQQAPFHHLKDFDDEPANLISSLHLDADEEPRRLGATSRANSVRFDESANQGHWAHASRSSIDFLSRSAGSLAGLGMTERSSSHKSDGRASSVHSVRSAASGRASSINLDTGYASPVDTPAIAPGLLILGPVPAIVRCWLNTNFKHDALLYAAVSTASCKSQIDERLIQHLGFEDCIVESEIGRRLLPLPVYFAEAIPHPISTRSRSPAPQVPSVTVEFSIVSSIQTDPPSKAIQVVIGSDVLRSRNADILFSSNSVSLYDDDQCKLSIPLVRPENEDTFNSLFISSMPPMSNAQEAVQEDKSRLDGLRQVDPINTSGRNEYEDVASPRPDDIEKLPMDDKAGHGQQQSPPPTDLGLETKDPTATTQTQPAASSPSIWSNWRRETSSRSHGTESEGATAKVKDSGYQRRDGGIKVLRPTRTIGRTFSSGSTASSPAGDGKSRYFDEGRKRGMDAVAGEDRPLSRRATGENQTEMPTPKSRSNPAGGASAFSWLHSGNKA